MNSFFLNRNISGLHDSPELLEADLSVVVDVGLANHGLEQIQQKNQITVSKKRIIESNICWSCSNNFVLRKKIIVSHKSLKKDSSEAAILNLGYECSSRGVRKF